MANLFRTYPGRALTGLILALTIGVVVVATCNTVWSIARNLPVFSLWDDASVLQVLIASAAFVLLSLLGVSAPRPWIVALFLTVGFWSFYTYVITRPYAGGGANIGLGILMLFSPLPIAGASLLSLISRAEGRRPDEKANGS